MNNFTMRASVKLRNLYIKKDYCQETFPSSQQINPIDKKNILRLLKNVETALFVGQFTECIAQFEHSFVISVEFHTCDIVKIIFLLDKFKDLLLKLEKKAAEFHVYWLKIIMFYQIKSNT